ncbi:alkaline phosphatase family protein [Chloroflexota bacterium]
MSRVLVVGIDSMDSILLSRFEHKLPNLKELKARTPEIRLRSVYPPDSVTAWASIYTGLNPAKHGMVYFTDPLDKVNATTMVEIDNTILKGNTFWDLASQVDKRVCVLFPHIGYPPWPVNGVMFARTNERDGKKYPVQAYPPYLTRDYELFHLNTAKTVPARRLLGKYIEACRSLIRGEVEFSLKMLAQEKWDLFFTYSSTLDWIQHNLWMFFDKTDPTYPGANPYQDIVEEFYILYDEFVGKLVTAAGSETTILVFSDHGHGMRPTTLVNVNQILRDKGLLVSKIKRASAKNPYFVIDKLKDNAASFINKHTEMFGMAMKLMRVMPAAKRLYTSPLSIDWDKTVAYVSDLSGIKAYTYGGLMIKRGNISNTAYEGIRSQLIEELSHIKEPDSSERLMKWICRREELYSGEYIFKYPDIVFEFRDGYGTGWSVYDSLLTPCRTHNIQPGSHKADSPVFLLANSNRMPLKKNINLMDIAPTILDILGVEGDFGFDGRSIFEYQEAEVE